MHPRSAAEILLDGPAKGSVGCAALEAQERLVHLWHVMHNVSEDGTSDEGGSLDDIIADLGYTRSGGSGGLVGVVVVESLLLAAGVAAFVYSRFGKGNGGAGGRSRTNPTARSSTGPAYPPATNPLSQPYNAPVVAPAYESPQVPLSTADSAAGRI